jgi:hypothetical protein
MQNGSDSNGCERDSTAYTTPSNITQRLNANTEPSFFDDDATAPMPATPPAVVDEPHVGIAVVASVGLARSTAPQAEVPFGNGVDHVDGPSVRGTVPPAVSQVHRGQLDVTSKKRPRSDSDGETEDDDVSAALPSDNPVPAAQVTPLTPPRSADGRDDASVADGLITQQATQLSPTVSQMLGASKRRVVEAGHAVVVPRDGERVYAPVWSSQAMWRMASATLLRRLRPAPVTPSRNALL